MQTKARMKAIAPHFSVPYVVAAANCYRDAFGTSPGNSVKVRAYRLGARRRRQWCKVVAIEIL
jgi:hypothetical protein